MALYSDCENGETVILALLFGITWFSHPAMQVEQHTLASVPKLKNMALWPRQIICRQGEGRNDLASRIWKGVYGFTTH